MAFIIDTKHGILNRYFPQSGETEITIPEHVRMIDKHAFAGCDNLYAVRFPEGVTNIGAGAFKNCKNLLFVKLPETLSRMSVEVFSGCESLGEIIIPPNITVIHDSCFMNCKNLRNVTFPETLQEIKDRAFKNCISLKKIKIPENVSVLGIQSFSHCEKLTSVVLPKKVFSIMQNTFHACYELRFVMIPENIQQIRYPAFPATTILHFCIQQQLFSIEAGQGYLVNAFCQPEQPQYTKDIITVFINQNDTGNLTNFLECGFVQDKRIDDFIQYAIEKQKYESQVVLMNYKHKHIGYQPKNWDL